jgi:hypothetical protein
VSAALGLLAAISALCVALPLVGGGDRRALPALSAAQLERVALRERRDAAYAALRELELDHTTGKLTDEDYARARAALRAEAVGVLAALDEDEVEQPREPL